ncbi:type III-B CRISPR module-associated Cmr3 family protein [Spirosoma litoris]
MASLPYLFRLKPVDTFFFGGERTFGYDGERSQKNVTANYFVESNRYPQQTALLGILRYKLLEANGWLASKQKSIPQEAIDWIGKRSFQHTAETNQARSYGHIHGLSPLFWLHQDKHTHQDTPFVMAPKDQGMALEWRTQSVSSLVGQGVRQQIPHVVSGYDPKIGLKRQLIDAKNNLCPLDYDEKTAAQSPYKSQIQEGILKTDQRAEDDQGFYKQTYYRFANKNWSFAFIAYLAKEAAAKLSDHLLTNCWATLGGEGRPFRLTMSPAGNVVDFFALPNRPAIDGRLRLTLLSDAFVTNEIYKECDFAITETVDFRPIESSVTVKNYANLNRSAKGDVTSPQKAKKYQLLERGSVLYTTADQMPALCKALEKPIHFCQIGYNAYHLTGQSATLFQPA